MRIPPPFTFVAAIVLGTALGTFVPLPVAWLPKEFSAIIGNILMASSIVLAVLALRELRKARTGYDSNKSVNSLVTGGPYAISRNPIYLAWAIFQLGLGIWLGNPWIVLLLVPAIILVNMLAIIPEERFLEDRFGQGFRDYRSRVRRWL
jgi:protein-S-isoprenylcysteine O-methyltransferase Ste14